MTPSPRPSVAGRRWRYAALAIALALTAVPTALTASSAPASASASAASTDRVGVGQTSGFEDPSLASHWYDITNQTVAAAAFREPVTQSDVWSVSWLAAARAVAAGSGAPFEEAALAQALHDALAAEVPSQQSNLDADLSSTLASIPDGPQKSAGIASGKQQASSALAERANDGLSTSAVDIPYTPPPPAPGVWQPTPPTYGSAIRAGEGNGKAYILAANNQFDPGPPPSLTSQTYLSARRDRGVRKCHELVAHPSPDRHRAVLGAGGQHPVRPDRRRDPEGHRLLAGVGRTVRRRLSGDHHRRPDRRLQRQVRVHVLAAGDRDPAGQCWPRLVSGH